MQFLKYDVFVIKYISYKNQINIRFNLEKSNFLS